MATRGDSVALRRVGVLPPVIELLKNATSNQKLWAAETLVTLASDDDDNCEAIMRGGAIPPLVVLLRSGTDMQKQEAAYALGNLAANNEVYRGKIAREGAIPPMVAFVKAVTDAQNQWAVYALGFLSVNNEENRVLIAQEDAIPPLVALLRTGTRAQKQWAAYTLGNLAHNDANRVEITQEGAIASLVELLRTGTAMVKQRAAFALGNLACDNDVATDFDEAILPLVELVRTGCDTQKEDAAYTLGNLASNNSDRRAEIGRSGAIPPLVRLLKTGHDDQKQWAAFALRYLAYNNELNRVAIVEEGAIPPLLILMDEGTDEQKEQASHALKHLVAKNDAITQAFIPDRFMTPLMGYLRAGAQTANVTALNTIGTVRESVVDLVDPLVGPASRWHLSHLGAMRTFDRLGDSLVTTLRRTTQNVKNNSLTVALWSRKLVKQLIEYESESRLLVRLTDTGRVLTTLFSALKTSAEVLNIRDPEILSHWRDQFMMEREERMNIYESLLDDKTQLTVERGDEEQQLEILTLMKNDVEMYGAVFNETEVDVISAIYDEVVQYSGVVVGCIPSWFTTTETSWSDGEITFLYMNEEELLRQVAAWSELRHPYVRKLYGACHVGRPFEIHEASCVDMVDELQWKDVLGVARGLEYVQERGYRHQQMTLLCLSSDKKLVLSGLNLVKTDASREVDESGVMVFTIALLALLERTRGNTVIESERYAMDRQLPETQPEFVTDREWKMLFSNLCTTVPSERLTTPRLVNMIRYLADQDVDGQRIRSSGISNLILVDVETFIHPVTGLSIKEILQEIGMICDDNINNINNDYHVRKRVADLYQQFKTAGVQLPLPIIDRFCEILWNFLLHLEAQQINDRSSTDSINSLFSEEIDASNYELLVHHQIDHLMADVPIFLLYSPVHDWTLLRQRYHEDALATWQQIDNQPQDIIYDEEYDNFSEDSEEEEDSLGNHFLKELVQRERFTKNAVAINFFAPRRRTTPRSVRVSFSITDPMGTHGSDRSDTLACYRVCGGNSRYKLHQKFVA